MSADARALYPYNLPVTPRALRLPAPSTLTKKSFVLMTPMYSIIAGGVSMPEVWKETPPSRNPAALIIFWPTARQLELSNPTTLV